MNVASFELCKELYEVSKWDARDLFWRPTLQPAGDDEVVQYQLSTSRQSLMQPSYGHVYSSVPAYSLGYLLRELPHFIELTQLSGGYTPNGWRATKRSSQDYRHDGNIRADGNTPEDALCRLAVELFKQGVLEI